MVMEDVERNVEVLKKLKSLGILIAIDDFGTGYSNLAHLKRFPVDVLKVDKSFVHGLGINPEDTAIVEAIISFARALNLKTVAEGIETTEQLNRLRDLGCDIGQGYYFSTPQPTLESDYLHSGPYVPSRMGSIR
jgi:EAL domain-containing protein (putative c-di-GMP-specific phosphodiesterase class I)